MQASIQPKNYTKVEISVPSELEYLFKNKNLSLEQLALLLYPHIQDGEISKKKSVSDRKAVDILEKTTSLDRGESEAIILFGELKAELMLMDERRGREVALRLKIPLSGTLGVLLEAFDKNIINREQTEQYLDEFQKQHRRFSRKILSAVKRLINHEQSLRLLPD